MTANVQHSCCAEQTAQQTRKGVYFRPNVDIFELPDELRLVADMPGAKSDTIDLHFEEGVLSVEATVPARYEGQTHFALSEYGVGNYYRTFRVGEKIDASRIQAEYSSGVLTIHLPKAEAARSRKIAVQGTN